MSTEGSEQSRRPAAGWHLLRATGVAGDADWLGDTGEAPAADDLAQAPYAATKDLGVPTTVRAVVLMLASGAVLGSQGTVRVTPIELLDHPTGDVVIGGEAITADIGIAFEFPLNGSRAWTIRLTDLDDGTATPDALQVWYRITRE
jgi:hypothetical protein